MPDYTPTEAKIMEVLGDGMVHSIEELHKCLWDDLSPLKAVFYHITILRRKLRPIGQEIVLRRTQHGPSYQIARFTPSPCR